MASRNKNLKSTKNYAIYTEQGGYHRQPSWVLHMKGKWYFHLDSFYCPWKGYTDESTWSCCVPYSKKKKKIGYIFRLKKGKMTMTTIIPNNTIGGGQEMRHSRNLIKRSPLYFLIITGQSIDKLIREGAFK